MKYLLSLFIAFSLLILNTSAQDHQVIESPIADVLSLNSTGSSATVMNFLNSNVRRAYISTNNNLLNFALSNNNSNPDGKMQWITQGVSRMTMTNDGNFGIGISNPAQLLDVNGQARIRNLPAAADTDSYVTADASGNLRKVKSPCNQGTEITSLPYTINNSGHYYISQNLSSGSTGIKIEASNVSLDLNGYSITGTSITDSTLYGIDIEKGADYGSVCNGFISNFHHAIQVRGSIADTLENIKITKVHAKDCTIGFIYRDVRDVVFKDCTASTNKQSGFTKNISRGFDPYDEPERSRYITFENCTSYNNGFDVIGGDGFVLGEYCTIKNCKSFNNGLGFFQGSGFAGGGNNIILNCEATENRFSGYRFNFINGDNNLFRYNIAFGNNIGFNLRAGTVFLHGNSAAGNTGSAISTPPAAANMIDNFGF